jgi:hypothetical protein
MQNNYNLNYDLLVYTMCMLRGTELYVFTLCLPEIDYLVSYMPRLATESLSYWLTYSILWFDDTSVCLCMHTHLDVGMHTYIHFPS